MNDQPSQGQASTTQAPPPQASSGGRVYLATLLVIAAAGFVAIWSLGQTWVSGSFDAGFGEQSISVIGNSLYPLSSTAAWVALAAVVAVVATSGVVRRSVGLIISIAGVAVVVGPFSFLLSSEVELATESAKVAAVSASKTSYWILTLVCGIVIFGAGLVVWARGGSWRGLSGNQAAQKVVAPSAWESLDRGEDPTK